MFIFNFYVSFLQFLNLKEIVVRLEKNLYWALDVNWTVPYEITLFFLEIAYNDSLWQYLISSRIKISKKMLGPKFESNGPKWGPKLGFSLFFQAWFIGFLLNYIGWSLGTISNNYIYKNDLTARIWAQRS